MVERLYSTKRIESNAAYPVQLNDFFTKRQTPLRKNSGNFSGRSFLMSEKRAPALPLTPAPGLYILVLCFFLLTPP